MFRNRLKKIDKVDPLVEIKKVINIKKNIFSILWKIYDESFEDLNKRSPCRQSFHEEDFYKILDKKSVIKYLISSGADPIGLALITNDLSNSPWISSDYFIEHYTEEYRAGRLFYFMGIVLLSEFRNHGIARTALNTMFNDFPNDSVVGFDHSYEFNRRIGYFPHLVKSTRKIKKKYLDSMSYYAVRIK